MSYTEFRDHLLSTQYNFTREQVGELFDKMKLIGALALHSLRNSHAKRYGEFELGQY